MIISIINQEDNIIFKYHPNLYELELITPNSQMVELATHIGYYKHGEQEKKIQYVSP